jgi:hypothetical protein
VISSYAAFLGMNNEDVVLALPARVTPVRNVRSTLILASIESIRKRGQFDVYVAALAPEHKETLLHMIAATWLPLQVALAHYAACDTLGLTHEQAVQSGRSTFEGSRGTLLGTAVRMAKGAGITPWNLWPISQRFWDRGCDGAAVGVVRAGPKDAHITVVECPLFVSPYFRHGLRGMLAGLTELFCERAYVTERRHRGNMVEYRAQWA